MTQGYALGRILAEQERMGEATGPVEEGKTLAVERDGPERERLAESLLTLFRRSGWVFASLVDAQRNGKPFCARENNASAGEGNERAVGVVVETVVVAVCWLGIEAIKTGGVTLFVCPLCLSAPFSHTKCPPTSAA